VRIDELVLSAFGRFHGERLKLGPGLCVLYGENEAGKSTVQKFILGMFYGFKRPGGRREYTADAERYRPWAGADYRGSMTYTLDTGRAYRVERLFEPGRDMARVFDAATGADLTTTFALDRRKELQFAEAQLGLDEAAFRSTAWVGQLAVGQLEAGRELVARVANLQESGREDLSVRTAISWLDEQVKEIGTERAAAKPYGRVLKALAARREELRRAEAAREEVRGWETALTESQAALAEIDEELALVEGALRRALLAEAEEQLARVTAGSRRIRELRAEAEALEAWAEVPVDGFLRVRQVMHEAEEAEAAAAAWRSREALLSAEAAGFGDGVSGTLLREALRALEGAEAAGQACEARVSSAAEAGARLRVGLAQVEGEMGARPSGALALVLGLGLGAAAGLAVSLVAGPAVGAAAGVLAGLGVWLWLRQRALGYERLAVRREGLQAQLAGLEAELTTLRRAVAEKQAEAARLAALAGAEPAGLRQAWADWQAGRERAASLERQAADAARRAEAEGLRASRAAASAAALLAEAGVESAADYEAAVARREAREKALAEARALEAALGALLGGATPEALAARLAELRAQAPAPAPAGPTTPVKPSPTLQEEVRRLTARRSELSIRASDLSARLDTALRDVGDPAALRRELDALMEEKAGYDAELEALALARDTISAVSQELHREFAPRLGQALSGAVAAVTGGRYTAARVDEQAAIRIVTADDRTVEPAALSGGTADQLYLALRLALLDLVTAGQEHLPLLLDDPFVQYDDRRAAAALAYLAEAAQNRQVVLMTCHRREVELARATQFPVHLIELSNPAAEA
jgi:uncharacterized protein YhaN